MPDRIEVDPKTGRPVDIAQRHAQQQQQMPPAPQYPPAGEIGAPVEVHPATPPIQMGDLSAFGQAAKIGAQSQQEVGHAMATGRTARRLGMDGSEMGADGQDHSGDHAMDWIHAHGEHQTPFGPQSSAMAGPVGGNPADYTTVARNASGGNDVSGLYGSGSSTPGAIQAPQHVGQEIGKGVAQGGAFGAGGLESLVPSAALAPPVGQSAGVNAGLVGALGAAGQAAPQTQGFGSLVRPKPQTFPTGGYATSGLPH